MSAAEVVLRTEALEKRFGSLKVTRGVTLELPRGARYALIGPNGAGKTTLINLITGQMRPDSGSIALAGRDITAMPTAGRVQHGLTRTFQINTLFPELTPIEAVTLAIAERERVAGALRRSDAVVEVLPSAANFLAVRFRDATAAYRGLAARGVLVRDVSTQEDLDRSLRITIGTRDDNDALLDALVALEAAA